jgi:WD40 repeat protein
MIDFTGRIIKGYELQEEIGVGGYGAVYRAIQPSVGREVAVKVILPQYANHPDFIRRFEAEAQIVARLEHPHIVPLYDYWREPDSAYLVMRWLRGGSLHERLTGQPWAPQALVPLLDQIAAALTAAHRHGVVHRDLKPANILLDEDGNTYLADFGIAKDLGSAFQTDHTGVIGSPAYISPEQIRAELISPRTDIYSLGIMLYEILTGELPFDGPTPIVVFFKHIHEQLPRLQRRRPELGEALNDVIQKATAKNPDERYQDVMGLVADYRAAVGSAPLSRSFGGGIPEPETTGNGNGDGLRTTGKRRTGSIYDTGVLYHTALMDAVVPAIENPYKGLRAFQEADSADFFGREVLTHRLLARLGEQNDLARFLAVIGPSGSGKSSVVRAGVVPALRRGTLTGSRHWFIVEMIPGAQPLAELAGALLKVAVSQPRNLLKQLQNDERGLLHATQRLLPGGAETELVLVIDQFEEVFTLVEDEAARAHFLNSLLTAVTDPHSRLRVILTLRADFYDRPLLYTGLSELVRQRTEVVTPLTAEELQHAIVGPAERVGVGMEADLVGAIVADVSEQPGMLPLLQYALTELFERRVGRLMTLDAYQTSGGVTGALARRADALYEGLQPAEQAATQQLFLRLVTLGEGMEDTRRRVLRSELTALTSEGRGTRNGAGIVHHSSVMDKVIDIYDRYRLLTGDRDPITRAPTVEVAHEALIRTWARLRDWLDQSRDDLRLQRRLASAAAEWSHAGRDPSYLASGVRLEQFSDWAATTQLALNEDERAYLQASLAERERAQAAETTRHERELALERRSRSVLRALVGVFVVATVIGLGLAALAFSQRQVAQRNAETARQQETLAKTNADAASRNAEEASRSAAVSRDLGLASGAQAAASAGNTDLALTLALAGNSMEPALPREELTLAEAAYTPGARRVFDGHTEQVSSVAFLPDGRRAVSGGIDKVAILWDLETGKSIRTFEGHEDEIGTIAVSPDGKRLLTGSNDTTMILWDIETGELIRTFEGQGDEIQGVAISHDGKRALSSSQDSTLILWDLDTGAQIRRLEGHAQEVKNAAFSPDDKTAISSSADQTLILWDLATGQPLRKFEGLKFEINDVKFSPDGSTILSGSADGLTVLWDTASGREIRRFAGHTDEIWSVAYSPDGKAAASGSADTTISIWDLQTGERLRHLAGHGAQVKSVRFSPDGNSLLSGSQDKTMRWWNLDFGAEIRRFTGHTDEVSRVAISPDGTKALSGSSDNTLILWDLKTGKQIFQMSGHEESIQGLAFSPDGKTAISAANDNFLILWNLEKGQFVRRFDGHEKQVTSVAFTPDGKQALSGSLDKTLLLWDVASAQPIRKFEGHTGNIRTVAISPDGKTAISGGVDNVIRLWDLATGQEIRTFDGHTATVRDVSFNADGTKFLSGSDDRTMREWDVASGKQIRRFPQEHVGAVRTAIYSPDGKYILSTSADTTLIVWDAASGQAIRRYTGHRGGVQDAVWSADGKQILSGSHDGSMILWRFDTLDELVNWAKTNRYVAPLLCYQADRYGLDDSQVQCKEEVTAGGS